MKILCTGAAGFIGSHVADIYIADGHKVTVLDNLSGGSMKNVPRKAKFVKMDLRDKKRIDKLFKKEKFDVVNNHAAQMSVPDSVKDPLNDADINVRGLLNLLQACRDNKVKKFIHVSSGGTVYGSKAPLPAKETLPLLPESPYGITKAVGERYLAFFHAETGMKYTVVRYSNVYGPRQVPHGEAGVVAIFIKLMMQNKVPTIFGDGRITRDYVYVGDVARINKMVLTKGHQEAFNVGTGIPTDVNVLYRAIAREMRFYGKPLHAKPRAGDLKANYLNWNKAYMQLGWKPLTNLKQGIKATADYFRAQ